jgi:hypothetical protein
MKPTKPPRIRKPPQVEMSAQIKASYEDGMLTITTPIRVNGFEMALQTGIDIRQIPADVWQQMQSARSKLILPPMGRTKH